LTGNGGQAAAPPDSCRLGRGSDLGTDAGGFEQGAGETGTSVLCR
jgi:hypothetical protein